MNSMMSEDLGMNTERLLQEHFDKEEQLIQQIKEEESKNYNLETELYTV